MALHNPPKQAPLLALLGQLAESGFLSANQITKASNLVKHQPFATLYSKISTWLARGRGCTWEGM